MKKVLLLIALVIILISIGQKVNLLPKLIVNKLLPLPEVKKDKPLPLTQQQTVVYEESAITKLVENALPSVVTIGIKKTSSEDLYELDPYNPFGPFRRIPGKQQSVERNIGSGFIITSDGLVITNKHVVADTEATYTILTNDKKKFNVEKIYRDPLNDAAILKITGAGLKPLKLGDSSKLKLGQLAVAIGTPLGEFTNTVTVGVVSGLGRGITAGSPFEGYVEKLDNVIQTDAAISPGNSGGPLLNSAGEVIGINTAIAAEGQNIGFALPSNLIKELLDGFTRRGGSFERAYIGVRYRMIDKAEAAQNKTVEGAYVIEVVPESPAAKTGIQEEDIITEFDGNRLSGTDDQSLAKLILNKKIGDKVMIKIWRNGESLNRQITLEAYQ